MKTNDKTTENQTTQLHEVGCCDLLALLPRHACSLELTHNQHLDYYETAEQRIAEMDGYECPPNWKTPESKAQAIATNELWELHWYPDTPIGNYSICAPTLHELLSYAGEIQSDSIG